MRGLLSAVGNGERLEELVKAIATSQRFRHHRVMAGSDEVWQMKDIDEEGGSLLDNSMVFFSGPINRQSMHPMLDGAGVPATSFGDGTAGL